MSREASPTTGKPYGVKRVCKTCQYPRSTLYAQQQRAVSAEQPPGKRGPKSAFTDEALLELIRQDLRESPFSGEGHRKVWRRLKFGHGVAVSHKRGGQPGHAKHSRLPFDAASVTTAHTYTLMACPDCRSKMKLLKSGNRSSRRSARRSSLG